MANTSTNGTSPKTTTDVRPGAGSRNKERDLGFADGDLGRIQGLLFGDSVRITNQRLDTLEQALLGAISDLRADMEKGLAKLDKQLTGEKTARTEAIAETEAKLAGDTKAAKKAAAKQQAEIERTAAKFDESLTSLAATANAALEQTRQDLWSRIDLTEKKLQSNKVDRDALATMLASTAQQLTEND